jgi:tetratricopeptide (TPR) repeat protein
VLFAAVVLVYIPAMHAGFIWDDDILVQKNPYLPAPDGLHTFWFTTQATDYFPLTFSFLWFEFRLWGQSPTGYHVVNILMHALGALVLWRMLRALRVPGAWVAALLYAVHPLSVATVAWVTELKNTLPQVLWPCVVLAWVRYVERGQRRWYVAALGLYAATLLAKTSVVGLPAILLLCAWWLRGRFTRRDALAVAPFLLVALALGLVTMWDQSHRAIGGYVVRPEGWASRVACAGWAVWFYLGKTVVPAGLTVVYPRWDVAASNPLSWVPAVALAGVLGGAWRLRDRYGWARGMFFALASFVLMLFPVLGLFQMAFHFYSLVADHWVYPALIAPVALVVGCASAWAARPVAAREWRMRGLVGASAAVAVVLAVLSWRRAELYADPLALWTDNIRKNPQAWVAYGNRAPEWAKRGYEQGQAEDTEHVLTLRPDDARALVNRARQSLKAKDYPRAQADLDHALRVEPDRTDALQVRAQLYRALGDNARALEDLRAAARLGTSDPSGLLLDMGETYHNLGRDEEALDCYTRATVANPKSVEGWSNRGAAAYFLKRYDDAQAAFTRAIALAPKFETPYRNRAALRYERGDYRGAVEDYTQALACPRPAVAECLAGRADAYEKLGDTAAAARDREALAQATGAGGPAAPGGGGR